MTTQLALFDPRLADALTCLRDAVPEALEAVVRLADWHVTEHREPGRGGGWFYSVRRDGLHFESLHERPAPRHNWPAKLARRITWDELTELVGADPRRVDLIAWSQSLTAPDAWKDRIRPHELWPEPGKWHPGYFDLDHERPGWAERITAWRTVRAHLH